MADGAGSSVTLIYYRIGERWWKEPFLNVVAAAAQMSALTHVEIAIGGVLLAPATSVPPVVTLTRAHLLPPPHPPPSQRSPDQRE